MDAKPLFELRDVLLEYVGFLSSFWTLGAVGFRYGILRSLPSERGTSSEAQHAAYRSAAASAAGVGFLGAILGVVSLLAGLLKKAEAKHLTLSDAAVAGGSTLIVQAVLLVTLVICFLRARQRISHGWAAAAFATLALALRNILAGRLGGMVNPLHVLGGGLWLGTLFVLVVCGLAQMMRSSVPTADREAAVAEMVHRFSTLALFGAGLLGITGLITAWTHLKHFAALWTTPYGFALDAKLVVVAIVALLGAWNWRRVGPSLGHDGGADTIRRTATTELVLAGVVLAITAVLVSLPGPKH